MRFPFLLALCLCLCCGAVYAADAPNAPDITATADVEPTVQTADDTNKRVDAWQYVRTANGGYYIYCPGGNCLPPRPQAPPPAPVEPPGFDFPDDEPEAPELTVPPAPAGDDLSMAGIASAIAAVGGAGAAFLSTREKEKEEEVAESTTPETEDQ